MSIQLWSVNKIGPKHSPVEMDAYARLKRSHALLKEEHEILKKFIRFSSEQKQTASNS